MNKQNAIRHILAKCEKCKTDNQYNYIHNFISGSKHLHHIIEDRCNGCVYDDFGICENTDDKACISTCLPRMVNLLKDELIKSQGEKLGIALENYHNRHNPKIMLNRFTKEDF